MAVFVFFHAHPDDEAIGTSGTICTLADAGHRVVIVFATAGEQGTRPAGVVDDAGLARVRSTEARHVGDVLGAARVEFLGYPDSGDDRSDDVRPGTFAGSDPDEAAARLAEVVRSEGAVALVGYDEFGITGHPDHLQVHRVGRRAAALLPGVRLYEGVLSEGQRAEFFAAGAALVAARTPAGREPEMPSSAPTLGARPDDEIAATVDVQHCLDRKRAAMVAHASQIEDGSFFLSLDAGQFARVFGRESYHDPTGGGDGAGPLWTALEPMGVLV